MLHSATGGDNCKNYCAAMGRNCCHAMDNVGQCGVGQDHTRQDMSENGCLQNWGGQICGCCAEGYTPDLTGSVCDGIDPNGRIHARSCATFAVLAWSI